MDMEANIEKEPLLLISHGELNDKHTLYSVSENQSHTTTIPILCGKRVVGSYYGWLVLVGDPTDCCLWNPTTTQVIALPELKCSCVYSRCILSKPPSEPDCHILFNAGSKIQQAFCRIGDNEFVEQWLKGKNLMAMASSKGKIYGFVGHSNLLVEIHLEGKTFEMRPILEGGNPWHIRVASPPWVTWSREYLINSSCDSELLLVRKMHYTTNKDGYCEFRVYRVTTDHQRVCMELENIDKRTIFIAHYGGGFCCSSLGIKPNSIYYTHGPTPCRNLYVYNLDDKTTTMLLPCPTVKRFMSFAFWVDHQLLTQFIN